jgi:hypothetical protein
MHGFARLRATPLTISAVTEPDFLDLMIERPEAQSPGFRNLIDEARRLRQLPPAQESGSASQTQTVVPPVREREGS